MPESKTRSAETEPLHTNHVIPILRQLAEQGWISLRALSILVYPNPNSRRAIYQRQRNKRQDTQIPTIRIGGVERVYEEDVLHFLRNIKEDVRHPHRLSDIAVILELYQTTKFMMLRRSARPKLESDEDPEYTFPSSASSE